MVKNIVLQSYFIGAPAYKRSRFQTVNNNKKKRQAKKVALHRNPYFNRTRSRNRKRSRSTLQIIVEIITMLIQKLIVQFKKIINIQKQPQQPVNE